MKLQREMVILPGYDKRHKDPSKDYGIHGCEVRFHLFNPSKTKIVQFVAFTDWLPRKVQQDNMGKDISSATRYPSVVQAVVGIQPMAADLGYHSPKPMYDGQPNMKCDISKGGSCYYDGSSLAADKVRDILLEHGSEGVWRELEAYWYDVFESNKTGGGFGETIEAFKEALNDEQPTEKK